MDRRQKKKKKIFGAAQRTCRTTGKPFTFCFYGEFWQTLAGSFRLWNLSWQLLILSRQSGPSLLKTTLLSRRSYGGPQGQTHTEHRLIERLRFILWVCSCSLLQLFYWRVCVLGICIATGFFHLCLLGLYVFSFCNVSVIAAVLCCSVLAVAFV